jgi:biotin carboxyl carrier protein
MKWQVLIDGNVVDIDSEHLDAVTEVESGVYSVMLGGDSFEVRLVPAAPGLVAEINGKRYPVEVRDPRNARRNLRNALGSGRQNVAAPMPGKVIRVLVKEGDPVEAGQGLVVVEAMKMQNEMKASRPARVVSVLAKAGDTIGAGDTLVVLE